MSATALGTSTIHGGQTVTGADGGAMMGLVDQTGDPNATIMGT